MHNDHDTIGTFPPGGIDDPGWTGTWWNWAAFILPNLEQRNIYNAINFSLGNITATDDSLAAQDPNVTVWRSVVNTYLCPSDSVGTGIMDNMRGVNCCALYGTPYTVAVTCYVASTGDMKTGNLTWDIYSVESPLGTPIDWGCSGRFRGMFGECSDGKSIGMRDCTDGTSNTFLIGENSPNMNGGLAWVNGDFTHSSTVPPLPGGIT